jgi:hypothetical protein
MSNLDSLKDLLKFNNKDVFYFLQILRRKKENENNRSNSLVISQYCITSMDYLNYIFPIVTAICDSTNSRAYVHLNARSLRSAAYDTNIKIGNQLKNKDYRSVKSAYKSVCGSLGAKPGTDKWWFVDIDTKMPEIVDKIYREVKELSIDKNITPFLIPTPNGYHLICGKFDTRVLTNISREDVHKDSPTLIYYPE